MIHPSVAPLLAALLNGSPERSVTAPMTENIVQPMNSKVTEAVHDHVLWE